MGGSDVQLPSGLAPRVCGSLPRPSHGFDRAPECLLKCLFEVLRIRLMRLLVARQQQTARSGQRSWLGEEPDPRDLMRPFPAEPMRMWPISTRVNKPENLRSLSR
jgi:hypothetical protein